MKIIRVIVGIAVYLFVLLIIMVVINLFPGRYVVEDLSDNPTMFKNIAEFDMYQTIFEGKKDNLNRIEIMFKNPGLISRDVVSVELRDDKDNLVIKENLSGLNLGDTTNARVNFSRIDKSYGKQYKVIIKPEEIVDGKLQVGVKQNNIYLIEYYTVKLSIVESVVKSISTITYILYSQPIVLLLPIFCLVLWLW